MNLKLIWFWIGLTVALCCIAYSFFRHNHTLALVYGCGGALGLLMIGLTLLKHKNFTLDKERKELTVKQIGREAKSYSLYRLIKWEMKTFIYNNNQSRSLNLFFEKQPYVTVTDKDDLGEFENLYHYLRTHYRELGPW
ncbi:hypothetical protein AB9P05_00090 [Roseivirga sp. BDSF3-8]|uniref:hypothetical protein n=1 Tax=Roseivirga sp. BDSF3-8 TaxID=3241598 RepID=UPI003531ED27